MGLVIALEIRNSYMEKIGIRKFQNTYFLEIFIKIYPGTWLRTCSVYTKKSTFSSKAPLPNLHQTTDLVRSHCYIDIVFVTLLQMRQSIFVTSKYCLDFFFIWEQINSINVSLRGCFYWFHCLPENFTDPNPYLPTFEDQFPGQGKRGLKGWYQ